jgi:tetratricopeptide (TPR) repeat protein
LDSQHALAQFYLVAALHSTGDHAAVLAAAPTAISLNPRAAALFAMVGLAFMQHGEFDEAARLFNEGLAAEPESLACLDGLEILSQNSTWHRRYYQINAGINEARRRVINRLHALHRRQGLDAGRLTTLLALLQGDRKTFPMAIELARAEANFPEMTCLLALRLASIFFAAGDSANTLQLREIAYGLAPQDPTTRLALSQAWLCEGGEHWRDAWPMMTEALAELAPATHVLQVPMWEGQTRKNPKILVYQNQGLGDALMGMRVLPLLVERGIRFDLWVLPALVDVAAMLTGYETLHRNDRVPDPSVLGCAFAVPLFGVIAALDLSPADLKNPPRIQPNKANFKKWRERIRALPGKRIGLAFAGNPRRRDDWMRSLSPKDLEVLARQAGVSWVNLNFDASPERAIVMRRFRMIDPMVDKPNLADTAAVIDELDAVIAIDGSAAHLSASLGRPTWVLAPAMADWHWQMGADTHAWWPSVTLLRGDTAGEWSSTVKLLAADLARFVAAAAATSP